MKKLFILSTLLFVSILAISGVAFGWGVTGGDGTRYRQIQEIAIFYNNTSSTNNPTTTTMYHGQAVLLDTDGSGVTSGSTLGSYVELPAPGAGAADSILVVGVVAEASISGFKVSGPVAVVTKGPAFAQILDSSDAVTINTAVGCATTIGAGNIGGGTNLGIALEAGDGTDTDEIIIWVDPAGSGD